LTNSLRRLRRLGLRVGVDEAIAVRRPDDALALAAAEEVRDVLEDRLNAVERLDDADRDERLNCALGGADAARASPLPDLRGNLLEAREATAVLVVDAIQNVFRRLKDLRRDLAPCPARLGRPHVRLDLGLCGWEAKRFLFTVP